MKSRADSNGFMESLHRISSFLTRSIRQESRVFLFHVIRGGLAFTVMAFFILQLETVAFFGSAGARFSGMILTCCYWFLSLVGGLYFSVAITEEKEEDTLALLRMTGVSNLGLLIGKSIPRLAMVILFLLVVLPFLVLSITMGGVVIEQLLASVLALMCYAFMLCQMGAFASTVAMNNRRAFTLMTFLWAIFELGYLGFFVLAEVARTTFLSESTASFMVDCALYFQERTLMRTLSGYQMLNRGDAIWSSQMTFQACSGLGFLILSWISFDFFNQRAIGQGLTQESGHRILDIFRSRRTSSRVAGDALLWKSWQFASGGWPWLIIRFISIPMFSMGLVAIFLLFLGENIDSEVLVGALLFGSFVLFLIECARLFGSVLNVEIYQKTLSSLMMLPKSPYSIAVGLTAGVIPGLLPSLFWFVTGWILMFATFTHSDTSNAIEVFIEPWFLHLFTWFLFTVHLGTALSTVLRYGGMVIAAAILWIVMPMFSIVVIGIMAFALRSAAGPGSEAVFRFLIPMGLMVVEILLCGLCQKLIVRRMEEVAGQ
ncbi:MAG: ABC transporter permease [Planctomyces sp.]|nr:ABC transporter permease [Planctomyces sp.]